MREPGSSENLTPMERKLLEIMRETDWDELEASKRLGINPRTFRSMLGPMLDRMQAQADDMGTPREPAVATLSVWQVADYLGVSPQRFGAIRRKGSYHFPPPLGDRRPRAWARADVEAWADARWWGTRPWRRRSPST